MVDYYLLGSLTREHMEALFHGPNTVSGFRGIEYSLEKIKINLRTRIEHLSNSVKKLWPQLVTTF